VALRAGVAVIAGGAVGLLGIRADAGRGVAGAGRVALVGGGADHRIAADAGAGLTGVLLRTRIAVVARGGVVGVHAAGGRVAGVVGAGVAVVAIRRRAAHAYAAAAGVVGRARVAVVAVAGVVRVLAAGGGVAGVGRAGVVVVAVEGWPADAVPVAARVG